jgi:hypothetical protein
MTESGQHRRLVQLLQDWVAAEYFSGDSGPILVDSADSNRYSKPPIICGFIPDLYARRDLVGGIIIGEAKTPRDLENHHTQAQLAAFLRKCAEDTGSVLVLATPWQSERTAKAVLRHVKRRTDMDHVYAIVLEQLGA